MIITFYICAAVAIFAALMAVTRLNIVHSLLYFIVSLLAVAFVFFILGAPFVAALVVIINAGAIIVLFVFLIMMLNLGPQAVAQERLWLKPSMWIGPIILVTILAVELIYLFPVSNDTILNSTPVDPKTVGIALLGPYVLGVELASLLLLAGLLGAYHLGRGSLVHPKENQS